MQRIFDFIKQVFTDFLNNNTFQKGAALAYYAVFSMLPMMMFCISVLGLFFGKMAVEGEIFTALSQTLGTDAAQQIETVLKNQHQHSHHSIQAIIGFVLMALGASGMLVQLHHFLNSIWSVKAKPKSGIVDMLYKKGVSIALLLVLFFVILSSTIVSSYLGNFYHDLHADYRLFYAFEHGLAILLLSFIFVMVYRFLSDAIIPLKALVIGSISTAVLFALGKYGIALYIQHTHIASTYGALSTVVLLMAWVYYSTQIIFLGASIIKVYCKHIGVEIIPKSNAVAIQHIETSPNEN
jgi:membrane protein